LKKEVTETTLKLTCYLPLTTHSSRKIRLRAFGLSRGG
jgi:hypothetical protein